MPSPPDDADRSWTEYRRLVLGELERLNALAVSHDRKLDELVAAIRRDIDDRDKALRGHVHKTEVDVAMLQVKSGIWGSLSGAISGAVIAIGAAMLQMVKH